MGLEIILGTVDVRQVASDILPQETTFLSWQVITTSNAVQDTVDISGYQQGVVTISGLITETISLKYLLNVTPTVSDPIMVRKTDGTYVAAATLSNGTYYFPVIARKLRLTKSAGVNTVTATFAFKATGGAV